MSLYCYCKLTGRSCIFYFLKSHLKFWKRLHRALSSRSLKLSKPLPPQANFSPALPFTAKNITPVPGQNSPPCEPMEVPPAAKPREESGTVFSAEWNISALLYLPPAHRAPSGLSPAPEEPEVTRWARVDQQLCSWRGEITCIHQVTLNLERALCSPRLT